MFVINIVRWKWISMENMEIVVSNGLRMIFSISYWELLVDICKEKFSFSSKPHDTINRINSHFIVLFLHVNTHTHTHIRTVVNMILCCEICPHIILPWYWIMINDMDLFILLPFSPSLYSLNKRQCSMGSSLCKNETQDRSEAHIRLTHLHHWWHTRNRCRSINSTYQCWHGAI